MKISTTEEIQGYVIVSSDGLVMGNTVQSKHIGRDIMAGLKTIVGGEIKGYTEMLTDARKIATQRMIDMASKMNADGVVCVRFTTSSIGDGMSELLAYGTAVKLKKCHVPPNPDYENEIKELKRKGNQIQAIKRYREITGTGLFEAKNYVDQL